MDKRPDARGKLGSAAFTQCEALKINVGLRTRASELAEASHSSMRVISWKEKQGGFQCSRPGEYEPGARHSTDGYRCNRVRAAAQRFRGSRFGAGSRPSRLQGEAYSPYLDAGHPYSPYLETGHLYPPYPDLAHPLGPDSGWQDNLYAAPAAVAAPEPDNGQQHLSPQAIAQAIEEHPGFDQDVIWQTLDVGPSEAEPRHGEPQAGTSHAGPSRTAPFSG
jgi:hypothetical protein